MMNDLFFLIDSQYIDGYSRQSVEKVQFLLYRMSVENTRLTLNYASIMYHLNRFQRHPKVQNHELLFNQQSDQRSFRLGLRFIQEEKITIKLTLISYCCSTLECCVNKDAIACDSITVLS